MSRLLFPAVAVLVLVFLGVQVVPHVVEDEVQEPSVNQSHADAAEEFGHTYVGLTGGLGPLLALAMAIIGLFVVIPGVLG
jgi:hypothetical protein